jgi:copper resistance protein B
MKRFLAFLLASAASAPALAQHSGHTPPAPPANPHAGHTMAPSPEPEAPGPPPSPHAGHTMPAAQAPTADPHAGHRMRISGADADLPPVTPPPPGALSGPTHAADQVYGAEPMATARNELRSTHGNMTFYRILIDRLEVGVRNGRDGYSWDAQGWFGGDLDRLWVKTEGEGEFGGDVERAEVQALWSHALDPWFNLQTGVRYDFRPDPERAYLVLGIQGLAPYWFEFGAAAFLSTKGDLSVRLEAEYDQRVTQRLILQPRVELDFSLQDVPELGIGSGLSAAEAGLRLRYEFVPEFAPYVGVQYERAFSGSADFARAAGREVGGWSLLAGVRAWF